MENQSHILLVTFPGQGHVNPSLKFANRLLQMGTKVTFLIGNYALNNNKIDTNPLLQGLTFKGFSEGFDEGLKLGKTVNEMIDVLKRRGSKALEEIIKLNMEKGEPFSRVIYTPFIPWVSHVARALNVPSTFLWIQPIALLDIYYYYFNGYGEAIEDQINNPSWSIEFPGLPRLTTHDLPSFLIDLGKSDFDALPLLKEHLDILELENNPKVLVNSFDELEYEALRVVKNLIFVPIGPLIPFVFLDGNDPSDKKPDDYIEWLKTKEKGSVIYISFGSYSELPEKQMEEIAKGLIETKRPFLWVIRKSTKDGNLESFRNELEKQGENCKIVEWCSQVEVLSHPSLGCFLSHCGWNSSLEALVCGVPFVCFPIWSDQNTNAKLIEDVWNVGIRVIKNEEGIVEGDEVERCVDTVMGGGEIGEKIKINSQKWKKIAREAAKEGGQSYLNLKNFVDQEIRSVMQD